MSIALSTPVEIEEDFLGAGLHGPKALDAAGEKGLRPDHFSQGRAALVFGAILEERAAGVEGPDELGVIRRLEQTGNLEAVGGKSFISALAARVSSSALTQPDARIAQILEASRLRRAHGLADRLRQATNVNGECTAIHDELRELLSETATDAVAGRSLALTPYSMVTPERVRWAWEGRIPLGALTILAGRQGLGKSTLLALLAAGLSAGTLPGDLHGQPATILTASFEDAAPQVAARLIAAGAELDRVIEVAATEDGDPDLLSFPADLDLLRPIIAEHRPRALLIDPVMAALPGGIDAHRDQDVRRALAPLAQLAEEFELAIVTVLHLRKGSAPEALDRVSGSVAFTAAARSVLAFGTQAHDDEDGDQDGRVLASAKSNLGPLAPSLAYRIEGAQIEHDGLAIETSRLTPEGEIDIRAGELLSPPVAEDRTEVDVAADWLTDHLADGEWHPTAEVREAAKAADIAPRTLQRAASRIGVERERQGFPSRGHWRLDSGAIATGATGGGATDVTTANGFIEPSPGAPDPQSRQGAHSGATTALDPDIDAAERIAERMGVEV